MLKVKNKNDRQPIARLYILAIRNKAKLELRYNCWTEFSGHFGFANNQNHESVAFVQRQGANFARFGRGVLPMPRNLSSGSYRTDGF
jgi:hypothetical protein